MRNIQIIDRADNATFGLFQTSAEDFAQLFPGERQDMEFAEDVVERMGEAAAGSVMKRLWERPIMKRDAMGIHGTLYYGYAELRHLLPVTKREADWNESAINIEQRTLFKEAEGRVSARHRNYECWQEPDGVMLLRDDRVAVYRAIGQMTEDARLRYVITAATGEEASSIHSLRQGFGPYNPMGEPDKCPVCAEWFYPLGSGECWNCGHKQ